MNEQIYDLGAIRGGMHRELLNVRTPKSDLHVLLVNNQVHKQNFIKIIK